MDSDVPRKNTVLKPIRWYRSLHVQKKRHEEGVFLVEGMRAISQIYKKAPRSIVSVICREKSHWEFGKSIAARYVSDSQYQKIGIGKNSQGPLAVVRIPEGVYSAPLPEKCGKRVLLLEDIQDPGNVGTLIRTAAGMNFSGIVMTDGCADPFSPKVVQASAGALLSVWIRRSVNYRSMVDTLKERGYKLVCADISGEYQCAWDRSVPCIIGVGNEGRGVSDFMRSRADFRFRIPVNRSNVDSYNAAVSGAICMYCALQHEDNNGVEM
jgi:TrmH family RNA methyltransferase